MLGLRIHTEDAEAIAIIKWIVEAVGVQNGNGTVTASGEQIKAILGKMGRTSLLTRAIRSCHNNFSENYLTFYYQKEKQFGRYQNVLMVKVNGKFFEENHLGMVFNLPLPMDISGNNAYSFMIGTDFLPQGYRKIRGYFQEKEVKAPIQSRSSWDVILKRRVVPKRKKRLNTSKEPETNNDFDESAKELLALIRQTEVGGMPYRILEERSRLNGELENILDDLLDANLIVLVAGSSQPEDTFVAIEYFDDN